MTYWDKVNSISDLKTLSVAELEAYAAEIRAHLIATVEENGGHLASNLGTVELTLALHYVFDSPTDKIVWDVGHQSYTHKIVTGRRDAFDGIRKEGGISGFPYPKESEYDSFIGGHSSTSLSAALGLARARDLKGETYDVISVIGDGAMTGGMAYEAINDIGESEKKLVIILNDNEMSISRNVGAFSGYLARLRLSKGYARIKHGIKRCVSALPFFGDKLVRVIERARDNLKSVILSDKLFENLGIKYYGPFDGHNLKNTVEILRQVRRENRPVLIHLITSKGKGYEKAQSDPEKFHGVSPIAEEEEKSFSKEVGRKLCELAEKDDRVVAVTAAMESGTGLDEFFRRFKDRAFDVAIAEQHAVTMAAGMAKGGLKPYFAVYSTFLQRGFDQVLHDVCIDSLPVTFLIDRAGVVGADGITHQGIFDLSYLTAIPGITVLAPKDGRELSEMLDFSLSFNGPLAIRYPKSYSRDYPSHTPIAGLEWEYIRKCDGKVYILAVGNRMLDIAVETEGVSIVNARSVKPLDTAMLAEINKEGNTIITMEDNVTSGGFGSAVTAFVCDGKPKAAVYRFGFSDFVDSKSINASFSSADITLSALSSLLKKL